MLKLKLHYFGHLMQKADTLEKSMVLGKLEGRRRGRQSLFIDPGNHHLKINSSSAY